MRVRTGRGLGRPSGRRGLEEGLSFRPGRADTTGVETSTAPYRQESARLKALARVAGAAAHSGGLDGVLAAVAEGVKTAFGFDAVLNLFDESLGRYVARAIVGLGTEELLGTSSTQEAFEQLMDQRYEVVPDVYFIPHDMEADLDQLSAVVAPTFDWQGPGFWHPADMCLIRMRTSRGKELGIISVDSPEERPLPTLEMFEVLRLFAMVGANAIENVMLMLEVKDLAVERQMKRLRQELQEEVALRSSLLDIGTKLGAASSSASEDIFTLLAQRLNAVVPVKALTIYFADHDARACRPIWHSAGDPDTEAILRFDVPFGMGATGSAALRPHGLLSNVGQRSRRKVDVPGTDEAIDEHLLTVPVIVEERVRAVLTLRRTAGEPPFLSVDARRAELFGQHVASVFLLNELAESRRLLARQVEQLQDLNRLKDEFVANVSHELRTPLTAIIGNVVTVSSLGDDLPEEDRRELLLGAERQAKRLAELLENLLAESRLTGDDPSLVASPVEIGPFLDEVAETLRFRAHERSIEVVVQSGVEAVTDRTLLYRVLFNLGDNALKYSDGRVQLEARRDDGGVLIEVVDEGPGISGEDIPRIFEQFQQLDGSSSRQVGGVGLGLHLCRRAVETLRGRISVRSELGQGSTFSVWLPERLPG
jgi:signal transduction histidine kinase